jgi:hypothetical protein
MRQITIVGRIASFFFLLLFLMYAILSDIVLQRREFSGTLDSCELDHRKILLISSFLMER